MKTQNSFKVGEFPYLPPQIDRVDIIVESGFAATGSLGSVDELYDENEY